MSVETYWVIGWLGNHADSTYPRLPKLYYIYTDRGGPPFTVYWTDNRAGATLFNMTQRSTVALPQGGYWSQVPGVTP